jgi:hypothetical protein
MRTSANAAMTTDATKPAQGRMLYVPPVKRPRPRQKIAIPAEKVSMIAAPISALPTEPT